MRIKKSTPFIVSSIVHLLPLLFAGWSAFLKPLDKPHELVQIDYSDTPANEKTTTKEVSSSSATKSHGIKGSLAQEKLLQQGQDFLQGSGKISLKNAGSAAFGGSHTAPEIQSGLWNDQVSFTKGVELTTFWQRLAEKVNRGLDYPADFANQRIQGSVRVYFYVDRKGRLQGDFSSVKGPEPLLNLYVMSSLIILLRDALPENLWADQDSLAVTMNINFKIYQFQEMSIKDEYSFENNELSLTRAEYVSPLLVDQVKKVFTRYVPPIIPIPGGFYVDIPMLVEYIQNINSPDPDEQRQARLKIKRQDLEQALKKKEVL